MKKKIIRLCIIKYNKVCFTWEALDGAKMWQNQFKQKKKRKNKTKTTTTRLQLLDSISVKETCIFHPDTW